MKPKDLVGEMKTCLKESAAKKATEDRISELQDKMQRNSRQQKLKKNKLNLKIKEHQRRPFLYEFKRNNIRLTELPET